MGNQNLSADSGPCIACRDYGGIVHGARRPYVECDSDKLPGAFNGDPRAGCRFWVAGEPREGKRIIACGGRDFLDKAKVFAALDAAHAKSPIGVLVHGDASGADMMAKHWARERRVIRDTFPADWNGPDGKAAGPIRNQVMADAGADGCIAFPGGRGTHDMTVRAELAGIPVWRPYG